MLLRAAYRELRAFTVSSTTFKKGGKKATHKKIQNRLKVGNFSCGCKAFVMLGPLEHLGLTS